MPARKPDGAGLALLMEELGATPSTTWMIGDSPVDVQTARAAGVRIAGVTWGLAPEELRQEKPDRLVDDAGELLALAAGSRPVLRFPAPLPCSPWHTF